VPKTGVILYGSAAFARASQQFLNGGSRELRIASNGGFTAVAVFKFTSSAGPWERIFDLASGPSANNLMLIRQSNSAILQFVIQNTDEDCNTVSATGTIPQDVWTTVVATYHPTASATGTVRLQVGMSQSRTVCSAVRVNRTVTIFYIGRSQWTGESFLNGEIAGLHVVDALLSSVEIAVIAARMRAGTDPLAGCAACAAGLCGPCGYTCPAGMFTANPFAVNLDDLTV